MQKIPLSLVEPSMKSAKTVRMRDGSIALNAGDEIDASIIRRLERAGVSHVVVTGNEVPDYDMGYDVQHIIDRLPYLFRNFQQNPQMMQFSVLIQKILEERRKV